MRKFSQKTLYCRIQPCTVGCWIITFSDKTAPSSPAVDCLQALRFSDTIILHIVSFVFECVHNLTIIYFTNYFTSTGSIHSICTKQPQ